MRSVCFFKSAMSYSPTWQCLTISSAASFGMMPSRACTVARAASISRYFWMRFSSEKTRRIASVEKMSRKIAESSAVAGMRVLCWGGDLDESRGVAQARPEIADQGLRPGQGEDAVEDEIDRDRRHR